MAIDDSAYEADHFGCKPGELLDRFVLLELLRGVNDEEAQRRVRAWLATTHVANTPKMLGCRILRDSPNLWSRILKQ
ncbi:hypothetical protein [Ralstonia sp. 24A2]|uniref:hypothetical protein n=1 Tax=Ralstonia sp. 24A2 TaxID=3447364 RepID=UPI003F69ED1E